MRVQSSKERSVIDWPNKPIISPEDFVKAEYSNPEFVRKYMTVGLWRSEEVLMERYFEPKSSVLDLGCGAGRATIAMAQKGFKVTGIDLIPEMIEAAKSQAAINGLQLDFRVMDARNLSFPHESYQNVLFSFNGFDQIPGKASRRQLLEDVHRILKPGGCFILSCRSGLAFGKRWATWIWLALEFLVRKVSGRIKPGWEWGDKIRKGWYHHYSTPFSIRKALQQVGLELVYFNSSRNIEKGKRPTFLTNFSPDKSLFFVVRKSADSKK